MVTITCRACGRTAERAKLFPSRFCIPCCHQHNADALAAGRAVKKAITAGQLPKATDCECADCGKPAREYDHRDYLKPLDVAPVCRPCNHKRGAAFNSVWRPAASFND